MTREEALNKECVKYASAQGEHIDDVKELINKIYDDLNTITEEALDYIEDAEETIVGEFGTIKQMEAVEKREKMPDIWHKLKRIRDENQQENSQ